MLEGRAHGMKTAAVEAAATTEQLVLLQLKQQQLHTSVCMYVCMSACAYIHTYTKLCDQQQLAILAFSILAVIHTHTHKDTNTHSQSYCSPSDAASVTFSLFDSAAAAAVGGTNSHSREK